MINKKFAFMAISALAAILIGGSLAPAMANPPEHSDAEWGVCHATGKEPNIVYKVIYIDGGSVSDHLDHGDPIGWAGNPEFDALFEGICLSLNN